MANKRIQDLEQTTDLTNDDLIPLDTTKKTFATTLKSLTEWLKNTFQTKDNLEQALSDATDKYPSSKVLKDESSRIVSVMDTKLAKKLNANAVTVGEITNLRTPKLNEGNASTVFIDGYMINSEDDVNGCLVAPMLMTNGTIANRLMARKKINGVNVYRGLTLGVKADGSVYTELDYSQNHNSIVTTVSLSSGYVRFGNGVQICWGNSPVNKTITLPQAFKNNTYRVAFCQTDNAEHNINNTIVDKTTTSFKFNRGYNGDWIAIGWWY